MADSKKNGDGKTPAEAPSEPKTPPIQAHVLGQYVKDLSFENPDPRRMMSGPGENPNLKIEVNVGAERVGKDMYESSINFKAHATNKAGTIYDMELIYAGLFKIQNIPEQALEPFLLINCPSVIFPFLRRLVADISREGGFPPLLLDPIDFAALFMRRQEERSAAATEKTKTD